MLLVSTSTLLLIAGVFWLVAGANVVAVGIQAYIAVEAAAPILVSLAMGSIATFLVFFLRIFKPYAAKHAARIESLCEERVSAFEFMDAKGYLMIAFMIALGAGLRLSGIVPDWFIAFFYVGLGMALALTGVLFIVDWRKASGR